MLPVVAVVIWALASTIVAMLPMRYQFIPGVMLLISAPVLIVWLGMTHGLLIGLGALAAFVSMFRHPLRYLWRKWVLRHNISINDPRP